MSRRFTEQLILHVDPVLKADIERAARADDLSVSAWLRRAIRRVASDNPTVAASLSERVADGTRRILQGRR